MNMQTDHRNFHAILVGIEKYEIGDAWQLSGPAFDVLLISAWLIDCGVPKNQIHLFVNYADENQKKFLYQVDELGLKYNDQPTSATMKQFFNKSLHKLLSNSNSNECEKTLLIFWAGHGSVEMDHAAPQRLVFCSDSNANIGEFLSINKLANFLGSEFANIRQIFITDVCALEIEHYYPTMLINHVPFSKQSKISDGEKFFAHATTLGGFAKSASNKRAGLFTEHLLQQLKLSIYMPLTNELWQSIFVEAQKAVLTASNGMQCPMSISIQQWNGCISSMGCGAKQTDFPIDLDSVISYCDRHLQWRAIYASAKEHFSAKPGRPLILLTHGGRNQDYSLFFKRIFLASSNGDEEKRRKFWGLCNVIEARTLLIPGVKWKSSKYFASDLREELIEQFNFAVDADELDIAKVMKSRCAGFLLSHTKAASEIREDPAKWMNFIIDFWSSFPDLGTNARVVFLIHIYYDPSWEYGLLSKLTWWFSREHKIRDFVANFDDVDNELITVRMIQPELTSVSIVDLNDWANLVKSRYPSWVRPTDKTLKQVLRGLDTYPMDQVTEELRQLLHSEMHRVPLTSTGGKANVNTKVGR